MKRRLQRFLKRSSSHLLVAVLTLLFFGSVYRALALNYVEPGLTLDPGADYPVLCADPLADCTTEVLRIGNPVGDGTEGSLLFVDSSGELAEDNNNLFWDNTTNRLGIGTDSPAYTLDIATSSSTPSTIGTPVEVGGGALDDISAGGTFTGPSDNTIFVFIDSTGTPDTFGWGDNNGDFSSVFGIPITGGAQSLTGTGMTVTFGATTGHDGNEVWQIDVTADSVTTAGDFNFGGSVYKNGDLWSGAIGGAVDDGASAGVLYVNGSGVLAQESSTFSYNDSTNKLTVGNLGFTGESSSAGVITFGSERLHSYGTSNTFWGVSAGNFTLTGTNNVGLGTNAGTALTTGTGNVCLGQQTCQVLTIGQNNIMIGKKTGEGQSSGNNNILIGFDLDSPVGGTSSDTLNIGNTLFGNLSAGSIGIGDGTPDYRLDVENTSVDADLLALHDTDGECTHNPEAGSEVVTCSSDERLKKNIKDADEVLPYFRSFGIREYNVRASDDHMVGVIAQEVRENHPELVRESANGYLAVDLPNLWMLVKAIQELDLTVTDLSVLDLDNEHSLAHVLIAWFSDAANGIEKLFAKEIHTDKLCVGEVCVTQEEFLQLLESNNVGAPTGGSENTMPSDDTSSAESETPSSSDGDQETPASPTDESLEDEIVLPPSSPLENSPEEGESPSLEASLEDGSGI